MSGQTLENVVFKPKIERGAVATPYSKFEQGNANFTISNKNILKYDIKTQTKNGITFTVNKDKSITANGTATANVTLDLVGGANNYALNLEKGDYVFSGCQGGSSTTYYMEIFNGVSYKGNRFGATQISYTEDTSIRAYIAVKSGTTVSNVTFYPMLERKEDSTLTSYVEHKEQNYTIPTQKEMLDGDKFEKIDGIWKEKHIWSKVIFNGTEQWRLAAKDDNNAVFTNLVNTTIYNFANDEEKQLSTHFTWKEKAAGYQKALNNGVGMYTNIENGNKYTYFVVPLETASTLEDWSSLLAKQNAAGTPLTIYYKSAEATYLNCIEEQIKKLDEIETEARSYKEKTHIFSTDEISSNFDVEWIKDTNIVLNNINKAIAGGN